jgi:hypothetical protein
MSLVVVTNSRARIMVKRMLASLVECYKEI